MRRTGLYERVGEDHLYHDTALAVEGIFEDAHAFADDFHIEHCPLRRARFMDSEVAARS
jgi:hypothetical protein